MSRRRTASDQGDPGDLRRAPGVPRVAPGLVYRTVIERRRPERNDSTFVEISRVALTSLVFSVSALAILWLLQRFTGLMLPDLAAWIAGWTTMLSSRVMRGPTSRGTTRRHENSFSLVRR
jgi:Family of unknown function (DUF6338)